MCDYCTCEKTDTSIHVFTASFVLDKNSLMRDTHQILVCRNCIDKLPFVFCSWCENKIVCDNVKLLNPGAKPPRLSSYSIPCVSAVCDGIVTSSDNRAVVNLRRRVPKLEELLFLRLTTSELLKLSPELRERGKFWDKVNRLSPRQRVVCTQCVSLL